MTHDAPLDIAVGYSARSRVWRNEKWLWSDFAAKLTTPNPTQETLAEYMKANKTDQSTIKDVGGYVGGYLREGRRKPENVLHRQLLTLDIDFAHVDFWDDFTMLFGEAAVLHATHSHTPDSPRYRLIMPLDREVSADEYVAIARRVAGDTGIELFDKTTFETNRLMFWPSSPSDVGYYAKLQDGPWLCVDDVLGRYVDWRDSSAWPTAEREIEEVRSSAAKQADPLEKSGVVGAFCRTYTIDEAIETFLPNAYESAGKERYTYKGGSTAAGLTVYEEKFAYSHHGTDPCSGQLCNAFDLVRVHKFGHLDTTVVPGRQGKSYKAMEDFACKQGAVKQTLASETFAEAKVRFAIEDDDEEEPDLKWTEELEIDKQGRYLSTAPNLNVIFAHDKNLSGLFRRNLFDGREYLFGSVPWRKIDEPEVLRNVDRAGIRNYIETVYGISSAYKIDDALELEFEKHSFHPVRDYLSSLTWDGVERIDTLLADYLGAEQTHYTAEAMRKTLAAAVARIFQPGRKFDLVLTLVGEQGTGKSTLVYKLGREWFSDTFLTVQGKEALEQIQGAWLIEIAELAGLRKAEVEAIKHFISKQEDTFRAAYARVAETYQRQCVFIGTTNSRDFLRDPSGNRRFMPVAIKPERATLCVFEDLDEERVGQIWAEAVQLYRKGEPLYLSGEAEKVARQEQVRHSETDERAGIIEAYMDRKLPERWPQMDLFERRTWLAQDEEGTVERERVCVAEIWCEGLEQSQDDMTRYKTRPINDILRQIPGWENADTTTSFPIYGRQRYYERKR